MFSFLKNRYRKEQGTFPYQFEIALVKRQQLLADAFQKQSKKFSRKTLYFFLAGFCMCFGTAFIRIAFTAIKNIHPVVFAVPLGVSQHPAVPLGGNNINLHRQLKYILNLEEYLDSLKRRDSMGIK